MFEVDQDDLDVDLPPSVDRAAIRRMQVVAKLLDDSIRVPGTSFKIGIDAIVGIVPGAGDAATGLVSLYIVAESARLGVSQATLLQMLANVAIDVGAGSIPVVGGIFDATWKANKKNFKLALDDLARPETLD